ncbi:MAG: hypothetical protein Tsb0014_22420 [Pleurocapsa sp.]
MNGLEEYGIALPLTQSAYSTAERFATEQIDPNKAERVRLNTLAVWLVRDYLDLMAIPTNITGGDSWNPLMRMSADVADLEITNVGYLECIPCQTKASSYIVPPEVQRDRIGYVVVQIDDTLREGTILGFSPTAQDGVISQLQSWDSLLVHLDRLASRVTVEARIVNLSQWLEGIFTTGWETVRDLLLASDNNLAFSFRSAETEQENLLRRGKILDLGNELGRIILLVEVRNTESAEKIITLQIYPTETNYLPPQIQLQVLDDAETVFATATSTSNDNYLQLQLHGAPGESFKVEISAANNTLREDFTI